MVKISKLNPRVDFYFSKAGRWQEEIAKLRMIVLECGLKEELKWGVPCYLHNDGNVVLIHVFKEYCALLFFKGVLLKDASGILVQQTKNVQSARQIRFTDPGEIIELKPVIKAYIHEAIKVEKAGLKVDYKKPQEFSMPEEFKNKISTKDGHALKTAFYKLTPGRQRAYLLYFSAPKQSKTRETRVQKYMKHIIDGKGLED